MSLAQLQELKHKYGDDNFLPAPEHEHDLNEQERGEDDVGIEESVAAVVVKRVGARQRLAYAF